MRVSRCIFVYDERYFCEKFGVEKGGVLEL